MAGGRCVHRQVVPDSNPVKRKLSRMHWEGGGKAWRTSFKMFSATSQELRMSLTVSWMGNTSCCKDADAAAADARRPSNDVEQNSRPRNVVFNGVLISCEMYLSVRKGKTAPK